MLGTVSVIQPTSSEELAALDAAYQPFPSFAQWPPNPPRPDVWAEALARLQALKTTASEQDLDRASRTAIRMAAFDTGAIEHLYETDRGLTITVATQAAAWEAEVSKRAPNALPLFKAQLRTYELVLDAMTQSVPVTEAWIRRLHEELTEPQETYLVQTPVGRQEQPLPHGEYKQYPNHVKLPDGASHSYVPVLDTPAEMERLVRELSSAVFLAADPVLQASYAHYAFVAVHPFADGNGRVARALASVYLFRAASIPLLIFVEQRNDYFAALEAADNGEPEAFVRFVAAACVGTLRLVADTISTQGAPDLDKSAQALREMLPYRENLTAQEFHEIAENLVTELGRFATERIASLELPDVVEISVEGLDGSWADRGWGDTINIHCVSLSPEACVDTNCRVELDRNDLERAYRVSEIGSGEAARQAPIDLALRDVYPRLTAAAEERLRKFIERLLGYSVAELQEAVTSELNWTFRSSPFSD